MNPPSIVSVLKMGERFLRAFVMLTGLPTVFEGDHAVQLQCSSCPASISSRWIFRHPVTDQISVLVPGRGHYSCRKKLGKFCPWIPVSDVPPKHARFEHLDFCPHKRELRMCKLCCGSRICEHQKRRDRCARCKHIPRRVQGRVAEKSSGRFLQRWVWCDQFSCYRWC